MTWFWTPNDQFSNSFEILSRQTFWPSFMIIRLKMCPLESTQSFPKISFSDPVLTRHDPFLISSEISSRQTFWPSFIIIGLKMWPLECTQVFSQIWPSNLIIDPTWPIFKLVPYFIKKNILTKFHDYQTENVASKAYTRFLEDLTIVTLFLTQHDPFSNSFQILSRQTFWPSFMIIELKTWPL